MEYIKSQKVQIITIELIKNIWIDQEDTLDDREKPIILRSSCPQGSLSYWQTLGV